MVTQRQDPLILFDSETLGGGVHKSSRLLANWSQGQGSIHLKRRLNQSLHSVLFLLLSESYTIHFGPQLKSQVPRISETASLYPDFRKSL